ncbi:MULTISPECIES: hypothetical protein, partial [unclassified Mesorhizobium]|uniref:hypothetical protein n=1 Tax=unclassified Mesorhizobium TaxID=325217 RepID=UPI0019CFA384
HTLSMNEYPPRQASRGGYQPTDDEGTMIDGHISKCGKGFLVSQVRPLRFHVGLWSGPDKIECLPGGV